MINIAIIEILEKHNHIINKQNRVKSLLEVCRNKRQLRVRASMTANRHIHIG